MAVLGVWEVFPFLLQGNCSKCRLSSFTVASELNESTALGHLVVG